MQRRTSHGVPRYDGGAEDEFVGPDGEVLVSERDDKGNPVTRTVSKYGDKTLVASYQVTRYFPRGGRCVSSHRALAGVRPPTSSG